MKDREYQHDVEELFVLTKDMLAIMERLLPEHKDEVKDMLQNMKRRVETLVKQAIEIRGMIIQNNLHDIT